MFWWTLIVILTLTLGLVARHVAPGFDGKLSWSEFALGTVLVLAAVIPLTDYVAERLAVADQIDGFHEFWNGSVTTATWSETACSEDGDCAHTYDCDPYQVADVHDTYDSKGNVTGSYTTYHTEYHACPYVTAERTYLLTTNIGETVTADSGVIAPAAGEWRAGSGLGGIQRGPGPLWISDAAELAKGSTPPITKQNDYSNYIIASQDSMLTQFSPDIARYRAAGIIPKMHTVGIPSVVSVTAAKAQFVAGARGDTSVWSDAVGRFNARLGVEAQGDLHVVVIPAAKVDNPTAYINALVAYWQSPAVDKWAIAKNSIILVIGVSPSGDTIEWAQAKTGMPVGNNTMLRAIVDRLRGQPFTVPAVFGTTTGSVYANHGKVKVKYTSTPAVMPDTVFRDFPFRRACMHDCNSHDKASGTGFIDLADQVQAHISGSARFVMVLADLILAALIWAALATVIHIREKEPDHHEDPDHHQGPKRPRPRRGPRRPTARRLPRPQRGHLRRELS